MVWMKRDYHNGYGFNNRLTLLELDFKFYIEFSIENPIEF